jgi:hypothetical protein
MKIMSKLNYILKPTYFPALDGQSLFVFFDHDKDGPVIHQGQLS